MVRESIQFSDGAMMIVENGQEYEVPMDGPMAIGMDIAGEMFGSRGVLLPLDTPSIRELAGVSEEDQGLLDAIIDDYRLSCADNLPEREIIEFSEDDPMSMMNMMADSENRRRERNQAIRSADELLFSTLSALFPERSAAISTFDITRQRVADGTHWIRWHGGHRPDVHGIRIRRRLEGRSASIGHREQLDPRRSSRLPHRA